MEAKKVSLIVKICTCFFIAVCCFLKWLDVFKTATISEICIAGGTLAGIFGDVSINLMMEKFRKNGGENSSVNSGGVNPDDDLVLSSVEDGREEKCESY